MHHKSLLKITKTHEIQRKDDANPTVDLREQMGASSNISLPFSLPLSLSLYKTFFTNSLFIISKNARFCSSPSKLVVM